MNNNYQIDNRCTISNKSYWLVADRVIYDLADKTEQEFVFAQIDKLYFVAKTTLFNKKTKHTNIGFWHTLFLNKKITIKDSCYFVTNSKQDGYFLEVSVSNNTINSGVVIANKATITTNIDDVIYIDNLIALKKVQIILTPKQKKLQEIKRNKIIAFIVILILAVVVVISEYQLTQLNKLQAQNFSIVSSLINRVIDANKIIITAIKPKTINHIKKHLPHIVELTKYPIWSGKIDFYKNNANLTTTNATDARLYYPNAKQVNINTWGLSWQ